MILYNVWFSFKSGSDEQAEIAKTRRFLDDLQSRAKLHGYRLMKNRGSQERSKLPTYQVVAEFPDQAKLDFAMAEVARIGIHSGHHGAMIKNVSAFHVEIFEDLSAPTA